MAVSVKEIAWLAGILEGEGSFGFTNNGKSPCIWLGMTDADVIEKVRSIIDKSLSILISKDERKENYKDSYRLTINGTRAASWMMIIYSFMSLRRKSKIQETLIAWKSHQLDQRYVNGPKAKEQAGFSRRMRKAGFASHEISYAIIMKSAGQAEEVIVQQINKLRTSMKSTDLKVM